MASLDTTPYRIIERRKHRRTSLPPGALLSFAPIVVPTETEEDSEGEGVVVDLSQGGCRVTSETSIPLERPYSLILQLPCYPDPVAVESAIARWVGGDMFGVMFIAMRPEQEQHLCEFLDYIREDAA
ncbi:MAG TPA: PilZ domain-containing protein [Nitrospira sp.]|nr:PilZ domain-containing protein [Nitrospira sp.]